MNYCFGVQSKNSVDVLIDFSLKNSELNITFIPSRRQIDYNGGYVNNWTTCSFANYVKSKNSNIKIERDHGGPGQGYYDDDGYESLREDCKYFDIIHIDPWKKYKNLMDGMEWTANMITFCYNINPTIEYEIGTEEAIRPFTIEELEELILYLKTSLTEDIYNKIRFLVIQSGTRLLEGKNTGVFDEEKLKNMLLLSKKYNLISKEHNGDWLTIDNIKLKQKYGLDIINIAPELGMIESSIIIDYIKYYPEYFDRVYNICLESNLWKKWVSDDFDYSNNKEDIIKISCHYHFTNDEIVIIKNKFSEIDHVIQEKIFLRYKELYHYNELYD